MVVEDGVRRENKKKSVEPNTQGRRTCLRRLKGRDRELIPGQRVGGRRGEWRRGKEGLSTVNKPPLSVVV
jgi:hypothetical protein